MQEFQPFEHSEPMEIIEAPELPSEMHFGLEPPVEPQTDRGKFPTALAVVLVVLGVGAAVFGWQFLNAGDNLAVAQNGVYSPEFLASAISPDSPPSPPEATLTHIVYDDGVLFIRGVASSEETVAARVAQLEEVFGVGNVIPEVALDPAFPDDPNSPVSVYFAQNVLFPTGSADIEPRFLDVVGASAAFLQLSSDTGITITGHTDDQGTEQANLLLSQQRVDAVREAMIAQGGDPDRITAIGVGEAEPIAENTTEEGRALNRRVELTIDPTLAG